jgi:tRNA(fMet)-specific endonuclease VapC
MRMWQDFLQEVPVVAFDAAAAGTYGPIRWSTRERKRDALDQLIAAHAVAMGVLLVTNNEADFASYPGLRVENGVNPVTRQ